MECEIWDLKKDLEMAFIGNSFFREIAYAARFLLYPNYEAGSFH